ncbi:MAG TPA: glycoside hydrolase family 3 N-terminal domain-containing protein, partial [Anaerolineales bacterium]|nr:glycoside hydrolase family 3 N-terminal domain-containing protein [Anaerolineales bacterium]
MIPPWHKACAVPDPMWKKVVLLLIGLVLLVQGIVPRAGIAAPNAQTDVEAKTQDLLAQMTTEEKIGQLFLVSFTGESITSESQIYDLIVNHHIGGVVLEAKNNNFVQGENILPATLALIQSLQQAEYDASQPTNVDPTSPSSDFPQYVPLFVGISQNGDGYPYDQMYSGLTDLPSPMAIGATWNSELAEQVGAVAGQELSALGFNLLLGPSLDVLEDPNPESSGDLGVRTFGGDSYWVGQMGSAYIRGVHTGSAGQMAVIAKNFPGYGSADRPPQEEVATIRKSLDQLKLLELVAFYPVAGKATSESETADGLLLSHIRYSGLLGNIRYTTPPITFDAQTFNTIFGEPEFASWKEAGGIVVTDDLSSQAVRRYYELSNTNFQAWEVTRDAFNAGNDLLFVGNITSSDAEDSYTSILNALSFFTERYGRDLDFQERVDQAVSRLLTLKFKLYKTFTIENVLPKEENLVNIGQSASVVLDVARQGITLLSPSLEDLETVLPNAPKLDDRIVFVTDTSSYQQCG